MLPDDALASLAESIRINGLRFPIVVRRNGHGDELIDGRNRLRACELAGIDPTFTEFVGDDQAVKSYIADVNLERRDLKKGQKAMALAMLFPEPEKGGRGKVSAAKTSAKRGGFSMDRVDACRAVRAHSEALAQDVLADRVPLDKALEQVKREQANAMGVEAKLARLRQEASDLADLVADDRLTLDEACAANEKRQSEREHRLKEAREAGKGLWRDIANRLGIIAHGNELGAPYVLPDNEREVAELVMKQLAALREMPR